MAFLGRLFRRQKSASGSYIAAGDQLTRLLVEKLPLVDWENGPPGYTEREAEAIGWSMHQFQHTSRQVAEEMGGEALAVHPDRAKELERLVYEQGLRQLGDSGWKIVGKVPANWRVNISAYLKAWICGLNPMVLLDIAELLTLTGRLDEANEAIRSVGKFPAYARSEGSDGVCAPEIVEQVMDRMRSAQLEVDRSRERERTKSEAEFDRSAEEFARQIGPVGPEDIRVTLEAEDNPRLKAFNEAAKAAARRKIN